MLPFHDAVVNGAKSWGQATMWIMFKENARFFYDRPPEIHLPARKFREFGEFREFLAHAVEFTNIEIGPGDFFYTHFLQPPWIVLKRHQAGFSRKTHMGENGCRF